jgi:hypothetical protein
VINLFKTSAAKDLVSDGRNRERTLFTQLKSQTQSEEQALHHAWSMRVRVIRRFNEEAAIAKTATYITELVSCSIFFSSPVSDENHT